jgi:hypothetical protein
MKIQFGKLTFDVSIEENEKVFDLKCKLEKITSCTSIKLIHNGKQLNDDLNIKTAFQNFESLKLTMIASKQQELTKMTEAQISQQVAPPLVRNSIVKKNIQPLRPQKYGFENIDVLPLPQSDKARSILTSLANDTG